MYQWLCPIIFGTVGKPLTKTNSLPVVRLTLVNFRLATVRDIACVLVGNLVYVCNFQLPLTNLKNKTSQNIFKSSSFDHIH